MVRRHLWFEIDQWEALPWWKQQVYYEGLEEEFGQEDSEFETAGSGDELATAAALGIQVRSIG